MGTIVKREELSPIVGFKLGGIPPPQRARLWAPLVEQILDMPGDGVWLQCEMREANDCQRAYSSLKNWAERNADQLECGLEMRKLGRVLWVRKVFTALRCQRKEGVREHVTEHP